MNDVTRRILDISYGHKLGHLSSTLSAAPIIEEIYQQMAPDDVFVLSSGHAALAWYCVLEKYRGCDAEELFVRHGVHPHRDPDNHILVSTGSLGMGITVACGHALALPHSTVWCLVSDGECGEGSVWEALRFAHERLPNLKVFVNVNGMIAYDFIDRQYLEQRLTAFMPNINIRHSEPPKWPWAQGVLTHYYVLKPEDYAQLCATDSDN